MEIIEHGKTYQVYTCPYCRCVFAACDQDFEEQEYCSEIYALSLICPECGSVVKDKWREKR